MITYINRIAIIIQPINLHRHPHKELIPSERKSIPKPKNLKTQPKRPRTTNNIIPKSIKPIIAISTN